MPTRYLFEKLCVSLTVAQLTAEEERFFYRLIVKCDDFGRYYAQPALLRAACFPLLLDDVSDAMVQAWLAALERVGLVSVYEAGGLSYLVVKTWDTYQRRRASASKFPEPSADCGDPPQSAGITGVAGGSQLADIGAPMLPLSGIRSSINDVRNSVFDAGEPQASPAPSGASAPATAKAEAVHSEQVSDTMATSDSREPQQNRRASGGGGAETGEAGPGATPDLTKNRPASRRSAVGAGLNRRQPATSGGTPPPESLVPNDADYAAGAEVGLTREQVASKTAVMLDHFRGKGESRSDWHATLRNWLRNAPKYDQPPRASPSNGHAKPPPTPSGAPVSYLYDEGREHAP